MSTTRHSPLSHPWQAAILVALLLMTLALTTINDGSWQWNGRLDRFALALGLLAAFGGTWFTGYRRVKAGTGNQPDAANSASEAATQANVLPVFYASQTGTAEVYAQQTARALSEAGVLSQAMSLEDLEPGMLDSHARALFIASTTDEGEPPYPVAGFVRRIMADSASLGGLQYGLLALGDSYYEDFCAFGRRLDAWLKEHGAQPFFPRIDVDDSDPESLEEWFVHIAELGQSEVAFTWHEPQFDTWRLVHREELNPGSQGEPVFHVRLEPAPGNDTEWRAGAIAEIIPRHGAETVDQWLAIAHATGDELVDPDNSNLTLAQLLATSELPSPFELQDFDAQQIAAHLSPLRARDFSIASLPSDGGIELLIRQGRRPDGSIGVGAGWLTKAAPIGAEVALRIRSNPNFATPEQDVPLILIGNGTGLAGLRALLHERIAEGRYCNWLVFGERQRDCDFYFRDELEAAVTDGKLTFLDLAFSRDSEQRTYVQDRLIEQGARLKEWVDNGAVLCVCGSLEGMAAGVDRALRGILGDQCVQQLVEDGRYRRDVY